MDNSNQDQTNLNESNLLNEPNQKPIECKKMVAGICAILLGALGIHKFVLGYNNEGIIILLVNIIGVPIVGFFTCGMGLGLYTFTYLIPIIEGVIYLTKTDEQFIETYQNSKKGWF